jgi:hypothetical protein
VAQRVADAHAGDGIVVVALADGELVNLDRLGRLVGRIPRFEKILRVLERGVQFRLRLKQSGCVVGDGRAPDDKFGPNVFPAEPLTAITEDSATPASGVSDNQRGEAETGGKKKAGNEAKKMRTGNSWLYTFVTKSTAIRRQEIGTSSLRKQFWSNIKHGKIRKKLTHKISSTNIQRF